MNVPHLRAPLVVLLLLAPLAALGAHATDATSATDPLAGHPEGSVLLPNGDVAIPLRMDTPSDYTPEVHRKVMAAADKGMAYDAVNDREVMLATNFLFIRPGAMMWSPSICTMNFIYGTPGNYKIGTAGHCVRANQDVTIVAYPGVFVNVGRTSVSHNNGPGDDFAIVPIRANLQGNVDANVADVWGPEGGKYTGTFNQLNPQPVKHIGHGLAIGTGGTPRAGLALRAGGHFLSCACVAAPGDSGSPILIVTPAHPLGQGFGILTHLVGGTSGPVAGTMLTAFSDPLVNGDLDPRPPA